jgi:hypothetical protein
MAQDPGYLVPVGLPILASELAQHPSAIAPPIVLELAINDLIVGPTGGLTKNGCLRSCSRILQDEQSMGESYFTPGRIIGHFTLPAASAPERVPPLCKGPALRSLSRIKMSEIQLDSNGVKYP